MKRRDFVKMGALSVTSIALAQSLQEQAKAKTGAAGADRLGETHTLGFSKIAFKASPAETDGGLFIMEHSNLTNTFAQTCLLAQTTPCSNAADHTFSLLNSSIATNDMTSVTSLC